MGLIQTFLTRKGCIMKGQWFIISAVIASSAFLGLSFLLKDYFVVDSSSSAAVSNDFYFNSIREQLDSIITNTVVSGNCINLTTNLNEFKTVTEKTLGTKGLFFYLDYNIKDCPTKAVDFNFMVASQDQVIYNFTTKKTPSEIIG